jgi:chromate transporter
VTAPVAPPQVPTSVPFGQALRFWFKLGWISFGGPAGQIALMHDELVVRRRWIGEQRFLHALNYCMLLPGPEAQQLATYLGWLMHRSWGGIAAGALFVLPSLAILIGLSWLYVAQGQHPLVAGIFYGIKPAVVAVVAQAAWRVGRRTLRNRVLLAIALAALAGIALLHLPFPIIVAGAAVIGWLGGRYAPRYFQAGGGHGGGAAGGSDAPTWLGDGAAPPAHARFHPRRLAWVLAAGMALWLAPIMLLAAWAGWQAMPAQMGLFFSRAALVTFGGAYAVLPYVVQAAVQQYGWLGATQMIDGLALGETTPGPLIMVVAFVGFVGGWQSPEMAALMGPDARLAGAVACACIATWFTFLPSFVFILAGAPWVESTHGKLGFTAPLTAITAAVVGVIANLALYFAQHVLWPQGFGGGFDIAAALIALAAGVALIGYQRGVVQVLVACAAAGLLWRLA